MQSVASIARRIQSAAAAYYSGEPIMSDGMFDELVFQLRSRDPDNKILSMVAYGYKPSGEKVPHKFTVGSLDKVKVRSYLTNEYYLPQQLNGVVRYLVSLKLDGGSAVAYYMNGTLISVVSRGDGQEGVNITDAVMVGGTVPSKLDDQSITAVRGEIVITNKSFEELGGSHPRNKAVGLSQSSHSDEEELKHLKFVAYDFKTTESILLQRKKSTDLKYLERLGFNTVLHRIVSNEELFNKLLLGQLTLFNAHKFMDSGTFDEECAIDGIVVTELVVRKNDPTSDLYRSVALKFEDEEVQTRIKDIRWKTSRTRRIVPVGILEPVGVSGAIIRRVTMNNAFYATSNQLGIGAKISIVRSNCVIPMIKETLIGNVPELPKKCPACFGKVKMVDKDLKCLNEDCVAVQSGSRHALINLVAPLGIGPQLIERIEDEFELYSIAEILNWAAIRDLDLSMFGTATRRLIKSLQANLREFSPTVAEVVKISNIPDLGSTFAKNFEKVVLVEEFISELKKCGDQEYRVPQKWLDTCGSAPARESLQTYIKVLKSTALAFEYNLTQAKIVETRIKVCITGALSMPRTKLLKQWEKWGVEHASASSCDVLIADGPSSSNKYTTASARGVKIMTEQEFVEMITKGSNA